MSVKEMLVNTLRRDLDEIIMRHLPKVNKIITVENLEEYKEYLEKIKFETKFGKTILFTNGNGWYVSTLIKNLIKSMEKNDPEFASKMGVICSDQDAYDSAIEHKMLHPFLVKIPLLKVDKLQSVCKPEDYTRLVFVKTVLIYHALSFGYNIIYIDPDMAAIKPSIQYIVDQMSEHGLVLAGIKDGNMNTNIIGIIPNENNINLFKVDVNTFEANLINKKIYGRYCCSDEEFIVIKDEYQPDRIHFIDLEKFPPGNYIDDAKDLHMLHANGISGLDNKVNFMKKFNGWFL